MKKIEGVKKMKTNRLVNEKYYLEEELTLSPTEVQLAVKEFLQSRIEKFQTGWSISLKSVPEVNVVCSKWTGFTCPKCQSPMTSKVCKSKGCQNFTCDNNGEISKCCVCLSNDFR